MLFAIFRRKWLPPPLRKLSQGKVDKTNAAERPLVKKGSEKAFKLADKYTPTSTNDDDSIVTAKTLPTTSASSSATSGAAGQATAAGNSGTHGDLEGEEEVAVELPPPMKPIQESQAIINNGPTVSSANTVEQSPCKRVSFDFFFFF